MSDQSDFEFASQFVASNKLDKAGKDILKLVEEAAADRRHALETAQKLSHQLQNAENRIAKAENRIAELEAEVQLYKAKIDRAKQWLHNIFSAIEERLLG